MTKHSYDKEFKEQAVQYYLDNAVQSIATKRRLVH